MNRLKYIVLAGSMSLMMMASCNKVLDVTPNDRISDELAIIDLTSAESAVLGMYSALQSDSYYGNGYPAAVNLLGDDTYHSGTFPTNQEFDYNQVFPNNSTLGGIWSVIMTTIYRANSIIERVPLVSDDKISAEKKVEMEAQARFIRAMAHFDALRLWGDVPIITTTDLAANSAVARSPKSEVYTAIIADLTFAEQNLPSSYGGSIDDKVKPIQLTATALLARVHLYAQNYSEAAAKATDVINSGRFQLENSYTDAFQLGRYSSESIFQIFASLNDANSLAFWYLPDTFGGRWEYAPTSDLVFGLEDFGGSRLAASVAGHPSQPGAYYNKKYTDIQNGTDQFMVLRLAEMYLIRSEARAQMSQFSDAMSDLNVIRTRSNLPALSAVSDTEEMVDLILNERFVELTFEGQRFFDLVRTGRADEIMGYHNEESWQTTDQLMPIPQREIQYNPNMIQNPGY